ncbi:MAG: type I pullulanase [Agathobacter sp.]|nr:type I pullulanase [Agathobacter sp.]
MFKYSKEFDEKYEYTGKDLGVTCKDGKTSFKIWAPFAEKVELCIYKESYEGMELDIDSIPTDCDKYVMEEQDKKVFAYSFDESLHGLYYDFLLYTDEKTVRTADPYATACSANGCRSAVVDLSLSNPEGFDEDKAPAKQNENIIYELQVKDFSYDKESGVEEAYRGKFKAFAVDSKGIEHMKELGITHVHLLPFYDFGWLDECGSDKQFNWGYDPFNFNVPEGSFATDVSDPTVRIRECKEMIQALHKAGIRVIMDVVYNHMYVADNWLERSAQGYYDRVEEDGTYSDGSACGNDMAAGRAMVDNYIVNSILYWAKEYHLDGFRFDLMGLLTTELMNRIKEELDAEYGVGEKFLYGEPWSAAPSPMEKGTHPANKPNVQHLNKDIAVFCDATRDIIKGDVFHADWPGFINGGEDMEKDILKAAKGWVEGKEGFTPLSCTQIINYVSAHDNYTLWDKLIFTSEYDEYETPFEDIVALNKLAAFMYFTCQGYIFFQAGEEIGRSKLGDENSFRSDPEINMIKWSNRDLFADLFEYYKGLIRLRKSLPGLYEKKDGKVSNTKVVAPKVVSFDIVNGPNSTLSVVYNASEDDVEIKLAEGDWDVLVDDKKADIHRTVSGTVSVKAHSGMMLTNI